VCNEEVAITNRLLSGEVKGIKLDGEVTYDTKIVASILDDLAAKVKPFYQLGDLPSFITEKKGRVRGRLEDAVAAILEKGVNPELASVSEKGVRITDGGDFNISMFLKTEIYDEEMKDPRMIAGRNPKFNVGYAKFMTPLELACHNVPQIMGGLNMSQRGSAFQTLLFGGMFLEADFSRFDSTQNHKLLYDIECGLMRRLLSDKDYDLFFDYWLVKMKKYGQFPSGAKFSLYGCRGSGDMDTKVMNTIINYVAVKYFLIKNGFPEDKFIVDGDDGVISVPRATFTNTFPEFGLIIDVKLSTDYHDVSFCSSHFMKVNGSGDMMQVQNFLRTYNNIGVLKSKTFSHCVGEYYYNLGYMYKILYPNCPGFHELSKFLMGITKRVTCFKPALLRELNPYYSELLQGKSHRVEPATIFTEMMQCYNISAGELTYMMDALSELKLCLPPSMDKRYRCVRPPTRKHSIEQYRTAEMLVDNAVSLSDIPYIYQAPILLPNLQVSHKWQTPWWRDSPAGVPRRAG